MSLTKSDIPLGPFISILLSSFASLKVLLQRLSPVQSLKNLCLAISVLKFTINGELAVTSGPDVHWDPMSGGGLTRYWIQAGQNWHMKTRFNKYIWNCGVWEIYFGLRCVLSLPNSAALVHCNAIKNYHYQHLSSDKTIYLMKQEFYNSSNWNYNLEKVWYYRFVSNTTVYYYNSTADYLYIPLP